jgi:hypothetical protein
MRNIFDSVKDGMSGFPKEPFLGFGRAGPAHFEELDSVFFSGTI